MPPGRILVLDDEENYAEMLQGLLKQHHFLVDMATKPELALEALEERNYNLVISDYKMPIIDGAVFLKKARDIFPDLPVILVSGLMNTPELVKVANMGVTLVLEKPLDTDYFIDQVRRFVRPMSEEEERAVEAGEYDEDEASATITPAPREYTYPTPLKYLAGRNEYSRRFVQEIWDILEHGSHLFATGPAGSEFDLVLREIANWRGEDGLNNHYISAGQLRSESVLEMLDALPDDPDHASVVAVGDLASTTLDEQAALLEFIRRKPEELPGEGRLVYAYWLDSINPLNIDLQVEIRGNIVKIPSLASRPGDIAIYLTRYLKGEDGSPDVTLDADAINLLLQFSWRRNFSDLLKVARTLRRRAAGQTVTYETLKPVLEETDDQTAIPPKGLTLEEVLIQKQQEVLRNAAERQGVAPKELLSKLGFDVSSMPPEMGIEHLDLLYPELLSK